MVWFCEMYRRYKYDYHMCILYVIDIERVKTAKFMHGKLGIESL